MSIFKKSYQIMLVDFLQADFKVLLYFKGEILKGQAVLNLIIMHFLLTKMHVNEHFN